MSDPDRSSPDWLGIVIRGICGAVFGAMVGFPVVWMRLQTGRPVIDWGVFAAFVAVFAFLSVRYGDEFWMSMRK